MLRTSLRSYCPSQDRLWRREFLSSNAQDFIEDLKTLLDENKLRGFLSSNAQDFIEEQRSKYNV